MAQPSPRDSPLPVIRSTIAVPNQQPSILPSRSPIPTPRNQNRPQNGMTNSPDVRRRTEPPVMARISRNVPNSPVLLRVEPSPTAQLLQKLFRNRDPRLLPDISEISPLTPNNSRTSSQVPDLHISEDVVYSEIPFPRAPPEQDDDDSSDYLSIGNSSMTINLDNIRTDSVTPPPAYRSIFEDEFRL